jgi:ABC-type sugar transport system substrate-binding protein
MTKLNVLVSLITDDNDFQVEQAAAAQDAARRLDVSIRLMYAGNDAVDQSQQLVRAIQSAAARPDAILVEPVGTGMPQVAAAASAAGVGWGVLNREVDYVARLRGMSRSPVFSVSIDQEEVGRIQAKQFALFLKNGGDVLYVEGPFTGEVAQLRASGMNSAKPENIKIR